MATHNLGPVQYVMYLFHRTIIYRFQKVMVLPSAVYPKDLVSCLKTRAQITYWYVRIHSTHTLTLKHSKIHIFFLFAQQALRPLNWGNKLGKFMLQWYWLVVTQLIEGATMLSQGHTAQWICFQSCTEGSICTGWTATKPELWVTNK